MNIIAVITNCALIAMSPSIRKMLSSFDPVYYVILFVFIEVSLTAFRTRSIFFDRTFL